jgi:hypothetical protein
MLLVGNCGKRHQNCIELLGKYEQTITQYEIIDSNWGILLPQIRSFCADFGSKVKVPLWV